MIARERERDILEGDRKQPTSTQWLIGEIERKIDVLEGPLGLVVDDHGMMKIAVAFYKDILRAESREGVALGFWLECEKVTSKENETLTAPFSEVEIKEPIFSCYAEGGGARPDGLPFFV
jgi:hypothetical protein